MSNKIIIFWTIIIFILLSFILSFGKYYLENEEYILLQQEFKASVKKYIKENELYPKNDEVITVNKNILVEKKYIKELKYKNKECDADAKVSKKLIFYTYNIKLDCE